MRAALTVALACWVGLLAAPRAGASDHVDLLYLADERPLIIRIHPTVDGKTTGQAWREYVDALFGRLDADNDQTLSPQEAAGTPTPIELMRAGLLESAAEKPQIADHIPRDGKVTKQELSEYFETIGVQAFSIQTIHPRDSSEISSGLFEHIDQNGDQKLSPAEMRDAYASLQKYDRDDDEFINRPELGLAPKNGFGPDTIPLRRSSRASDPSKFIRLQSGAARSIAETVLKNYDKDADGKLPPTECGLADEEFGRVDRNADGVLNLTELTEFIRSPHPPVEITLRIGAGVQPTAKLSSVDGWLASKVRRLNEGLAVVMLKTTQIDARAKPQTSVQADSRRYKQIFARADADKNKYLDINEARRFINFRRTFEGMDRDQDEKVYEPEMLTYVINQVALAKAHTILTVTNRGQDLAEILDINRDTRLSRRELVGAIERLKTWDADGDGQIAKTEVPHQYELSLGRGSPSLLRGSVARTSTESANRAGSSKTPVWFQRMDRNGDRELSRREFLGSAKRFRQFDKNNDGLISPNEASRRD